MQGLPDADLDFSFKKLFLPLTTTKAITWIIIIGFIIYTNSLFNGSVWEDNTLIFNNPLGHSFDIFSLNNTFNLAGSGQYRPVAALYTAIIYILFNSTPFFYHFFQVILHIVNTTLLFFIFKKFLDKKISFFLCLIFLVHPMNVDSVSYIGSLDNPLFFVFGGLASLLTFKDKLSLARFITIIVLLILSLLSKETGALFILIILFYQFLFKKKYTVHFFVLSLLVFFIYIWRLTLGVGATKLFLVPIDNLTFSQRLLNAPAIVLYYLKTFLFPVQLAVNQQWVVAKIDFQDFFLPLLFDMIFFGALFILGRYLLKMNKEKFQIYLFFLVWFLSGLLFHLQIIPLNMTVADHWFYFPMVGFLGMIGCALQELNYGNKKVKEIAVICAVLLIGVFSVRTIVRNVNWYSDISLFGNDSAIQDNASSEIYLGDAYFFQKQYSDALIHYKKSVEIYSYPNNLYDVAKVYEMSGNLQNAEEFYYATIKSHDITDFRLAVTQSYENLANILTFYKSPTNTNIIYTIDLIKGALKIDPNSVSLWGDLAINEYRLHDQKNAIISAEKAQALGSSIQTNYVYTQIFHNKPLQF